MKRIGLFVDVSNLYYTLKREYKRKLDYAKLKEFVEDMGEIQVMIAYGASKNGCAKKFIYKLDTLGYQTKFKEVKTFQNATSIRHKADQDVAIAVDMLNMCDRLDLIILVSADGDLLPAVETLMSKGINVLIIGCNISHDFKAVAREVIEIPQSLLEN